MDTSAPFGLLSSIDLYNCDEAAITDADTIRRFLRGLVEAIDMRAFGEPIVVRFGNTPVLPGTARCN
jgi:hypothetical protein